MDIIDFHLPADGFANGLQVWTACHERATRVLSLFERLLVHVQKHGSDAPARTTATELRRYFEEAIPRHHDDEDDDVFPVVLARAREARLNAEADAAAAAIDRLMHDHLEIDRQWPVMRELLTQVETEHSIRIDWPTVASFVGSSLEHHAAEERIVRPLAEKLLTPEDLGLLGRVMARRRSTTWDALAAPVTRTTAT